MRSEKQRMVHAFLKQHEKGVLQRRVTEFFFKHFRYKDMKIARIAIGRMLRALEAKGKAKHTEVDHEGRGSSIRMNLWFAC